MGIGGHGAVFAVNGFARKTVHPVASYDTL